MATAESNNWVNIWHIFDKYGQKVNLPNNYDLLDDFFHEGLAWTKVEGASDATRYDYPAGLIGIAYTLSSTETEINIDGKSMKFDSVVINGNTYLKLRDVAGGLSETSKCFDVS